MKAVFGAAIVTALVLTQYLHAGPQEPTTQQPLENLEKQARVLAEQLSQQTKADRHKVVELEYDLLPTMLRQEAGTELQSVIGELAELLGKKGPPSTYFDGIQWELHHHLVPLGARVGVPAISPIA